MTTRTCRVCGRLTTVLPEREGRCRRCMTFWRQHGAEWVATPPRPCATCGRLVQQLVGGRCKACYNYWRTHGVERPARLWQRD
jgi:hypothetical protein